MGEENHSQEGRLSGLDMFQIYRDEVNLKVEHKKENRTNQNPTNGEKTFFEKPKKKYHMSAAKSKTIRL